MNDNNTTPKGTDYYKGLGSLLHKVRWTQYLLAIVAEVLILLSFAMSGMDVSLGGIMASIPLLKILWAAMFALGIDTAFALSWVRVRRHLRYRQWLACIGNGLLALGMSFVIFEPVSIQLLQQSLDLNFNQAVVNLGVNIVLLIYARAGVAVFLGAILAITNTVDEAITVREPIQPKQRRVGVKKFPRWIDAFFFKRGASRVTAKKDLLEAELPNSDEPPIYERVTELLPAVVTTPAHTADIPVIPATATEQEEVNQSSPATQPVEESAQPTNVAAHSEPTMYDTPEGRAQKVGEITMTGLSISERVAAVIALFPDISDRELGKLSGTAPATAKKYR